MISRALPRPSRPWLLLLALAAGGCATGEGDTGDEDGGVDTDVPVIATPDVPTFDLVNPFDDVGETDTGVVALDAGAKDTGTPPDDAGTPPVDVGTTPVDAGTPPVDVGTPPVDAGVRDAGTPDVGGCTAGEFACGGGCVDLLRDARNCGTCGHACGEVEACSGGTCTATCAAPRMLCGSGTATRCVDVQTDAANCGRCGTACTTGNACTAGVCATATCMVTASDCDGNSANGCEVIHGAATNACSATVDNLGAFCGDTGGGFLCLDSNALRVVATRRGTRSQWYRGRLNECSSCPAALDGRLVLTSPPGVDYDLYVYSACGRLIGSSRAVAGTVDQFTLSGGGSVGSNSFDFYVEVRWYSGASCTPFTLTYQARSNSST